jgi:hypothetical protein
MMIPHPPYRLPEKIMALSVADVWDEVRLEWALSRVYFADGPAWCICGHPISECCLIVNHLNGAEATVGNVCVTRFLGLDSERIFRGFRRVMEDHQQALGLVAVDYAFEQGWINNWARTFYLSTSRKRTLSRKQLAKRIEINEQVLRQVKQVRCEEAAYA